MINIMKNTVVIVTIGICAMSMIGCQREDHQVKQESFATEHRTDLDSKELSTNLSKVDKAIIEDAIAYYGKVITLADFPSDKLLDNSYQNKDISPSDIGGSPENALVAVIFDNNGILYTPKRFNNELDNKSLHDTQFHEYLTDLQTYHDVTKVQEATAEYARPMYITDTSVLWIFDAYVKFFQTRQEIENEI